MGSEQVSERVRGLFRQALNIEVASPDVDLIDAGLLDSLGLVDLLFALEQEFGVQISFDTLEIETFRTISNISSFIGAETGNGST